MKLYDVAIIGSGAAGSMGTLRAVLNNLDTITFMGNAKSKKSARATWVGKVENMPCLFDKSKGVFQSANEVFKWINSNNLWKDNLTQIKSSVVDIAGSIGDFHLTTDKGDTYRAQNILLATGIMDIQPLIQGEIEPIFPMTNAGYIEYCIICDGHKCKGLETVIIGHGESAAWIAAMLYERYRNPSMAIITNGKPLQVEAGSELEKRLHNYKISIYTSPILEIVGDSKGSGLEGFKLEDESFVKGKKAYVSLGIIAHNQLAIKLGAKIDERGFVEADSVGETNIPGLFVAGDLRANLKNQIYTAWDMAVDSINRVDRYIRDVKR